MPSSNTTPKKPVATKKSAAKKPSDRKTPTTRHGSSWKRPLQDLELPSGETCQVRRVGVERLIKEGLLHSMDTLTSVVQGETIPKAEGKAPQNIESAMEDPKKFGRMMEVIDQIVVMVVTEPKILSPRRPILDAETNEPRKDDEGNPMMEDLSEDERDPNAVYADYIDLEDRVFIMNFAVGGSADLQQFRQKAEISLGSVPDGEAAPDSPE